MESSLSLNIIKLGPVCGKIHGIPIWDVSSCEISFQSLNNHFPGLRRGSIWIGRSHDLGFMIRCPVAEKSLSQYTKVAGTLRMRRVTTADV